MRVSWPIPSLFLLFLSVPMLKFYTILFMKFHALLIFPYPKHRESWQRPGNEAYFRHHALTNEIAEDTYPYLGALSEHRDKTILSRNL